MQKIIISIIIGLFVTLPNRLNAKAIDTLKIQSKCLDIHNQWMEMAIDLTKNTPGYTAPVTARTFNYFSIAIYESSLGVLPKNRSLTGQLQDFQKRKTEIISLNAYTAFVNQVDYEIVCHFFSNMSPKYKEKVDELYKKLNKQCFLKKKPIIQDQAKALVNSILLVAQVDGGANAWNNNFPASYDSPNCDACWVKTSPGYISALQPYWGRNKLMLADNREMCEGIPYLPFSTDKKSQFYQEVDTIYKLYGKLSDEQVDLAKYWDDGAGVSGTPVGHLFNIAFSLAQQEEFDLQKTVELYALLGISLNDAVIESWRLKYHYNLIRPITYIQKYISPKFSTPIATPPFPEFPSGHSFQAGASNQVFNFIFGDSLDFTDNTNVFRVDINGTARKYSSFDEMGEEMSLSRFFGAIHYLNTLDVSLEYGRRIGKNTVSKVKLH